MQMLKFLLDMNVALVHRDNYKLISSNTISSWITPNRMVNFMLFASWGDLGNMNKVYTDVLYIIRFVKVCSFLQDKVWNTSNEKFLLSRLMACLQRNMLFVLDMFAQFCYRYKREHVKFYIYHYIYHLSGVYSWYFISLFDGYSASLFCEHFSFSSHIIFSKRKRWIKFVWHSKRNV